ncbi:MAG TPA: hypothetical protein PK719_06645 [Bacteroidales bacterium]|jgi:hypothetical protein|nr:hypothetical protein [Bacteroidales bacterium]OQB61051.1 MAG: hypothetical protein BWX96_01927 [Bacteroidetes bacterium ADurb.Bin145]NMD02991.1 hypothetical protein [Bacteroidales bacterium]HOU03011.1 hypothetical protein [Bacteroidales bacterium]HQG63317.1 hypothetical protein [Bacteroidales bacterium]
MKSVKLILIPILFLGAVALIKAQDIPPTTTLVYPGTDGKLVYVADSLGNKIPDFSNAGYKGGGVPIPYVANKVTVWPVLGDNSANIQAAIDKVSALPLDASGFRGAVLLKMGTYELEKPITIKASGVVLRGEGMSEIGTILIGKIPKDRQAYGRGGLVNISGPKAIAPQEDTKQIITDKYVPVGARSFNVASAKGFKVGDKILVRRIGNQDWIKEIGEDSISAGRNKWRPFNITYDRVIVDIKGNTITTDVTIFTAVDARWGGGEILKYTDERIEQSGIENLRGISEYNPSVRQKTYGNMDRDKLDPKFQYQGEEYFSDENHVSNFIVISNAKNVWIRNISALHFATSVIQSNAGSKWITVQDCESWEPVSQRWGGRRFIYQMNGQLCLVQRCFSQKGRHSFVLQNAEASGNVFLNCEAVNPYSTSEPHNHWVNGVLYDNVKAPLTARYWDYIIGWAGANIVFWNCEGDFLVQSPPTAKNYSFGHIGINAVIFNAGLQDLKKPNGHVESMDYHVTPKSLYLTQLKERLGIEAVMNVITEGQSWK